MFGALVGGIVSAAGSLFASSKADKERKHASHEERRKYEKYAKKLMDMQREQIQWKKGLDLKRIQRTAMDVASAQRTGYAARGVRVGGAGDESTAGRMMRQTFDYALEDMDVIKQQAKYEDQESYLRYKAGMPSTDIKSSVGSTLLTSGTQFIAGGFGGGGGGWYGLKF